VPDGPVEQARALPATAAAGRGMPALLLAQRQLRLDQQIDLLVA
jgi:hypothetical protein